MIQRGHTRQIVFADDDDYQYDLENLWEWKEKLGCRLYAYCLMANLPLKEVTAMARASSPRVSQIQQRVEREPSDDALRCLLEH